MSLDVWLKCDGVEVFEWNITHNLRLMAERAGIAEQLWRPDCNGWSQASQIMGALMLGIDQLIKRKDEMQDLNPENGWGDYDGLLKFACEYASACFKYPSATIGVSR